jgi:hypothetical protein
LVGLLFCVLPLFLNLGANLFLSRLPPLLEIR